MFYQNEVIAQLGEGYEVFAPEENCRFSSYILNSLRYWLNEVPSPDIIHFNAGLWDTAILYREDGCFIGVDEYVKNMRRILRELKKTGATVIFATTTPVSEEKEKLLGPNPPAHRNEDIINYNKAALEAFNDEQIDINDLFTLLYAEKDRYLSEDMIHPNEDGIKLLGYAVANAIKACGAAKNKSVKQTSIGKTTNNQKLMQ